MVFVSAVEFKSVIQLDVRIDAEKPVKSLVEPKLNVFISNNTLELTVFSLTLPYTYNLESIAVVSLRLSIDRLPVSFPPLSGRKADSEPLKSDFTSFHVKSL
jgi:hypothetical protein